jgi:hypothetical protein
VNDQTNCISQTQRADIGLYGQHEKVEGVRRALRQGCVDGLF